MLEFVHLVSHVRVTQGFLLYFKKKKKKPLQLQVSLISRSPLRLELHVQISVRLAAAVFDWNEKTCRRSSLCGERRSGRAKKDFFCFAL